MKTMNVDDGKTHTLPREEQTRLWEIAKSGERRRADDAIRELSAVARHMRKVAKAANAARKCPGPPKVKEQRLDAALACGIFNAIISDPGFDPDRGVPFLKYAEWWIREAIAAEFFGADRSLCQEIRGKLEKRERAPVTGADLDPTGSRRAWHTAIPPGGFRPGAVSIDEKLGDEEDGYYRHEILKSPDDGPYELAAMGNEDEANNPEEDGGEEFFVEVSDADRKKDCLLEYTARRQEFIAASRDKTIARREEFFATLKENLASALKGPGAARDWLRSPAKRTAGTLRWGCEAYDLDADGIPERFEKALAQREREEREREERTRMEGERKQREIEQRLTQDGLGQYVIDKIGRDRRLRLHLGVEIGSSLVVASRVGNNQAIEIGKWLKNMEEHMPEIRAASSLPRAGVWQTFSDPLTFEDLHELRRLLGVMVAAYDEQPRPLSVIVTARDAALAIVEKAHEANRRLGPTATGGERKLRKDGKPRQFVRRYLAVDPEDGELCMHEEIATRIERRYIAQPEFVRRCLDVDPDLPMDDTEFWMHLLIDMQIDIPPDPGRVVARRHEIAKILRDQRSIIERGDRSA